jgi:hypothetical protein
MKKLPVFLALACVLISRLPAAPMFDFVLPRDDFSKNDIDLSWLNHTPAGRFGHVTAGSDGHLHLGKGTERIRFLGVNMIGGDCFPEKGQADAIARRLAKFGINLVRFHFADSPYAHASYIDYGHFPDSRHLDAANLDRLDYFFSVLKANGIYALLPLLDGRRFSSADGLPKSVDAIDFKDQQIPAMLDPAMIQLQKEHAKRFLARTNPYTGTTYLADPAVAFVEVMNEMGLVHAWLNGRMDALPAGYRSEIRTLWHAFLKERYRSFSELRKGWGDLEETLSPERLENADFSSGALSPWWFGTNPPSSATCTVVPNGYAAGRNSVKVRVSATSDTDWHTQLLQKATLDSGHPYTIRFSARADRPVTISVGVSEEGGSWQVFFQGNAALVDEWRDFEFTFAPSASCASAGLWFRKLAAAKAEYRFAGVSFRQGGRIGGMRPGESDFASLPIFFSADRGNRTEAAKRDWVSFLLQKERDYWTGMNRYLKSLGVHALVHGTQVGFSTPTLMNEFDIVDSHGYWHYPAAEKNWWDSPWWVGNSSLAGDESGGPIGELSMRRVAGKPFIVSEYNHTFPNSFGAETYLILSAYAAFQDWDAVFAYCYGDGKGDQRERRIGDFFQIESDPGKWGNMLHAALIFRRGDVSSARRTIGAVLTRADEIRLLPGSGAFDLVNAASVGIPKYAFLLHGIEVAVEGGGSPRETPGAAGAGAPNLRRVTSDTGELTWSSADRTMVVDTPKTKSVAGYCIGRSYDVGGITIRPKAALRNWATISMSLLEGESLSSGAVRILVTACGFSTNTGVEYRLYPSREPAGFPPRPDANISYSAVGSAPTITEGIEAELVLPYPAARVSAWCLDATGARRSALPVSDEGKGSKLQISAAAKTIWYLLEISP